MAMTPSGIIVSGQPNFGPHAEWKSRPVLWVVRDGVLHVARHSATMPGGVVSQIVCGGGSTFWPEGATWYAMKRRGRRFCRECVRWVEETTEGEVTR